MNLNKNDKFKILVLFVQYNQTAYNNSFDTLKLTLSKYNNYRFEYIVIDNSINEPFYKKTGNDVHLIHGENIDREFSGWQRGFEKIADLGLSYDILLFINEAYMVYKDSYLTNYLNTAVGRCLKYNAVVGMFDREEKNRVLSLNNFKFRDWLRSNIFLVPREIALKIGNFIFVSDSEFESYVPSTFPGVIKDYNDCFTANAPLNDDFKQKIFEWMTELWHSKIELNAGTWGQFRIKAKAIINEASLTIKIRSLGYKIIWYVPPIQVYSIKFFRNLLNIK